MTQEQYIETVENNLNEFQYLSTGLCPGCAECKEEPWFSSRTCEICGTNLGGNRVSGHCVDADGEICHIDSICTDCECYIANGDVPSHGPDGNELTA